MSRDFGVTQFVRAVLPDWTVPLFEFTAMLGDELVVVGVLLVLAVAGAYESYKSGDDRPVPNQTGFILAVVLGGLALTLILKTVFGLSRPPAEIQAVPREGDGFPSGHTMAAAILWTALALWTTRSTVRRRLATASILIVIVGFSRLALGVHYVVDVVASVVFGVAYLILAERFTGREPTSAFIGAAVLGTGALIVTGGTTKGWLAFGGCIGGGALWWICNRPSIRRGWSAVSDA